MSVKNNTKLGTILSLHAWRTCCIRPYVVNKVIHLDHSCAGGSAVELAVEMTRSAWMASSKLCTLEWLEVLWRILTSGDILNDMHISRWINKITTMVQYLIHNQSWVPARTQKCYCLRLTDYLNISPRSKAFESPNLHVPEYMCSKKLGTINAQRTDACNTSTHQSKVRGAGGDPGCLCVGIYWSAQSLRQWVCHNYFLLPIIAFLSSYLFQNKSVWI